MSAAESQGWGGNWPSDEHLALESTELTSLSTSFSTSARNCNLQAIHLFVFFDWTVWKTKPCAFQTFREKPLYWAAVCVVVAPHWKFGVIHFHAHPPMDPSVRAGHYFHRMECGHWCRWFMMCAHLILYLRSCTQVRWGSWSCSSCLTATQSAHSWGILVSGKLLVEITSRRC